MNDEQWDNVLKTNLNSAFYTTKGVIKSMMKNRFGRIINISSIVGLTGNQGQGNYSASKAGFDWFRQINRKRNCYARYNCELYCSRIY